MWGVAHALFGWRVLPLPWPLIDVAVFVSIFSAMLLAAIVRAVIRAREYAHYDTYRPSPETVRVIHEHFTRDDPNGG